MHSTNRQPSEDLMKDDILVSICIPAFNASKYIAETLESVMFQTHNNWELIVVEDGSDDGTHKIVCDFKKEVPQHVLYIRNARNLGLPATRNVGVSACKGGWIAFLDSDDLWHKDHLRDLINTSLSSSDCDLIHSGVELFDSATGKVIAKRTPSWEAINELPVSLFTNSYIIQPSSVMVSRRLYEVTGGFNEHFKYVEDLEMWFKCIKSGFKIGFTGKNTCLYRKHAEAMTTHAIPLALGVAGVYDRFSDWDAIPKRIRINFASAQWLAVARITRKKDRNLAKESLLKSISYRLTFKHVFYWIFITITSPTPSIKEV